MADDEKPDEFKGIMLAVYDVANRNPNKFDAPSEYGLFLSVLIAMSNMQETIRLLASGDVEKAKEGLVQLDDDMEEAKLSLIEWGQTFVERAER